ncbi:MAG: hypothetical protein ABIZ91_12155, partial [Gemmatimonadaceae bacterium]
MLGERALRGLALAALALLLWRGWHRVPAEQPSLRIASTAALSAALTTSVENAPRALHATLDSLPGEHERDWLRALDRAGTRVTWDAPGARQPPSLTIQPLADPSGRARLTIVGAPGSTVALRDAAGPVDSTTLGETGVHVLEVTVAGSVRAHLAGASLSSALTSAVVDSQWLHPVLVLARAGWEGKFVAAALEESGWSVDTRFVVTSQAPVLQGATSTLDTAHYSAVIALDESAASMATAIRRFVRDGGGVILSAAAAQAPAFVALLPARVADTLRATPGALATETPRAGLRAIALRSVARDAVVLEWRERRPVVVAARESLGRVVLVGFDETWRWRMQGGDEAPAAHRAWWSGLVSSVAYASRRPLP